MCICQLKITCESDILFLRPEARQETAANLGGDRGSGLVLRLIVLLRKRTVDEFSPNTANAVEHAIHEADSAVLS